MKILIVSNLYYPNGIGGAEKVVQNVAEELAARGHDVAVATLSLEKRYKAAQVNGVRVHYLPARNLFPPGQPRERSNIAKLLWHAIDTYNPLMAVSLGHILDIEKPDVVNTHNIQGFSVSAWHAVKRRGLPLVGTSHGVDHLCPWGMMRNETACSKQCYGCRIYAWPRLSLSGKVDVMTGVSCFTIEKYCQHRAFPSAEKMVIYSAYEHALRSPSLPRYHYEPIRFGFIGRLHRAKGVHLLVRSFLELPEEQADLLIAGRGTPEYEGPLRKLTQGLRQVRWLGFVSPEAFLCQIDVLVVPSLCHDAAPLAALEGMAWGRPIIGSRVGGIPELMGKGTGWTFDPRDPGALTDALRRAIDSRGELKEMGDRAAMRARQFSTEGMVNDYLKAFSCAIDKNNKDTKGRRAAAA